MVPSHLDFTLNAVQFLHVNVFAFLQVNLVKREFSDHSEDVDRINQICKTLQMQLNKMKSFEEPPFENEANAIVDRWLDVCKKVNDRAALICYAL